MRNSRERGQFYGSKRNDELVGAGRDTHPASRYGKHSLGNRRFLAVAFLATAILISGCRPNATTTSETSPAWQPSPMGEANIAATFAEAAACQGYDGTWRCPRLRKQTVLAASGGSTPVYPSSWNVPAWFINPSTGSDSNSCTSSGSPCQTWGEIAQHRWGTVSPFHSVNVAFSFLAGQPSPGYDQIVYKPTIGVINGTDAGSTTSAYVVFTGTLTAGTATTFTLLQAKSRSANQGLKGTFGTTPTNEILLQNTTHASFAWNIHQQNFVSQPMTATTISTTQFSLIGTEVDTWATSDSITPNTVPHVNFTDVEPILAGLQGSAGVTITHVFVPEDGPAGTAPGDDHFIIGDGVQLVEDIFEKQVVIAPRRVNYTQPDTAINCAFVSGAVSEPGNFSAFGTQDNLMVSINAGYMYPTSSEFAGTGSAQLTGTLLDYDVWFKSGSTGGALLLYGSNFAGFVDLEGKAVIQNGVFDLTSTIASGSVIYGAAGVLDSGNGMVLYKAGAGGAVASIPVASLRVGGGTACMLSIPSAAVTPITGNEAVTAANFDAILGATSGSCTDGIGGGFKNFGN